MIDVINEQISGFPLASFLVGELKHVILSHAGSYRKKCHSIFSKPTGFRSHEHGRPSIFLPACDLIKTPSVFYFGA